MTLVDTFALSLVAIALATMPAYAYLRHGRRIDADVASRPVSVFVGYWVRDWLMWVIGPAERLIIRAGVSPDAFNFLGVLFGAGAGLAFALHAFSAAGWLVLLGGLADIFDGRVARARGLVSTYGAFMDSTLDRFAEVFAFAGVAWGLSGSSFGAAISTAAIGGSMLVSYARARGEALGVSGAGGVMQRAERLVVLALAALLDAVVTTRAGWAPGMLLIAAVTVIAVGATGTAVYRTYSIARLLAARDGGAER